MQRATKSRAFAGSSLIQSPEHKVTLRKKALIPLKYLFTPKGLFRILL